MTYKEYTATAANRKVTMLRAVLAVGGLIGFVICVLLACYSLSAGNELARAVLLETTGDMLRLMLASGAVLVILGVWS